MVAVLNLNDNQVTPVLPLKGHELSSIYFLPQLAPAHYSAPSLLIRRSQITHERFLRTLSPLVLTQDKVCRN